MFFAGGGTNGAVEHYSAYTISKIASIKVCELLAAEYPEHVFFALGPGWVDTKIHEQTLMAGPMAGRNHQKTRSILRGGEAVPMKTVVEAINTLMATPGNSSPGVISALPMTRSDKNPSRRLSSATIIFSNFEGKEIKYSNLSNEASVEHSVR